MNNRKGLLAATFLTLTTGAVGGAASLSACSSDSATATGGADAQADTQTDSPVSPSDGGGDAAHSSPTGSIAIFSSAFRMIDNANIVFDNDPHPSPACTVTVTGGCRVTECTLSDSGAIDPPEVTDHASAGTISFHGGSPETSFTAPPKADGSYEAPTFTLNGRAFRGGEAATLTASGDKVPAFSQSLTYPVVFILEQPAIADGGSAKLTVPRNQDFTFAWSRGTADADVILQGGAMSTAAATYVSVSCTFAAAAGTGTVPQATLAKIPAGTEIALYSAGKATTQAGAFAVTTYLAGEVVNPAKTEAVTLLLQ